MTFQTKWVKSLSNEWYKFEVPVSLKLELTIISILKDYNSSQDALSLIVSEVLSLPIETVEDELTYHQLTSIVNLVIPQVSDSTSDTSDQLSTDGSDKNLSTQESISKMIAFLSYHGKVQPSEVLRLPRVIVMEMMKEISELLSVDKKMEYELSVVSALSKIFGGDKSSGSGNQSATSKPVDGNTIDLSTIDTDSLINKLGTMEGITGSIKVER